MGILHDWYITTGNAGRLCVLPERMMKNRESLRHIKCTGIVDAVEQLKNYEKEVRYCATPKGVCAELAGTGQTGSFNGILEPESPFRWLCEGEHLTEE